MTAVLPDSSIVPPEVQFQILKNGWTPAAHEVASQTAHRLWRGAFSTSPRRVCVPRPTRTAVSSVRLARLPGRAPTSVQVVAWSRIRL